jgi:hypothetical protein
MKLLVFLFLASILVLASFQVQAQQQDTIIIEVGGYAWNKTTLNTLIVTSENQSWWSQDLINSTLRSIDDWNQAIAYFSLNYSEYGYLSAVNLVTSVSSQPDPGYDIYVNFTNSVSISGTDAIGITTTVPYNNGTIQNCLITLATQTKYLTLTQKDMQSVATHELGHAIGIGHSNSSSDLMYPNFDVYAAKYEISTLDLYGVANAFQWLVNPDQPMPSSQQDIALPPNIPYSYVPTAQPAPQTIADNPVVIALKITLSMLLTPYILLMIIVGIILIVSLELFLRRKRRHN